MHHTDCGATHFDDVNLRSTLKERLPPHLHGEVEEMGYGGIKSSGPIEEDLKKDVAWIRGHQLIREELRSKVYGCLYDIETGVVKTVDMPEV